MQTITKHQRQINILHEAIKHGFEIDENADFREVINQAEYWLIEYAVPIREKCDVINHGTSQYVSWADKMGFEFSSSGQIVDFLADSNKPAGTQIVHSVCVDSLGRVVELYYEVEENEWNAPNGYTYEKGVGHVLLTELLQ